MNIADAKYRSTLQELFARAFKPFHLALVTLLAVGCSQPAPMEQTAASTEPAGAEVEEQAEEIDYLFVHGARGSELAGGVLRLVDVEPATLFFSDRPERIAGHLTTQEFVAKWGEEEDSFASNPPNATLSILSGEEPQEIVVVLNSPRLEGAI